MSLWNWLFLPFAKRVVLHTVHCDEVRDLVIQILRLLARYSDNDLDDHLVDLTEIALFQIDHDKEA